MKVTLTINALEKGKDALTGKEAEGVWVSFEDGSFTNVFLSHKSLQKIYTMKANQSKPTTAPVTNNTQQPAATK